MAATSSKRMPSRAVAKAVASGLPPIDFAGELNREQLAVVTCGDGATLVIAGAGSGKTRALTYRVAWLLAAGVPPANLLLLTFTNRAAREMLERVERLTGQGARQIWGGTFHHVANRLLREHGWQIGLPPRFGILDQEDSRALLGSCLTDLGVRKRHPKFPGRGALLGLYSLARNTMRPLARVVDAAPDIFCECLEDIELALAEYERRKQQQAVLDFDDLLVRFLELLTTVEEVRELLADHFRHVLVDEFQDTNALQHAIVRQLAARHGNLCVVGDDSQSIYSFRGAVFENILDFQEHYPGGAVYRLETNYRSTPEILALANANIANNRRRLPKELRAVRPSGQPPLLVRCQDQHEQTRFVGLAIEQLLAAGTPPNEIAVLYRSHYHSLQIQMELQRRKLNYQVRGGLRFFEQAHVKDILAFLRIILNGHDQSAWLRILPQLPRVGEKSAERFWWQISQDEAPLARALDPDSAAALPGGARADYLKLAEVLRQAADCDTPAAMLETLVDRYYARYLEREYDQPRQRLNDVFGVLDFARDYARLDDFLAEIALVGDNDRRELGAGGERPAASIVMSTIHQAKGLEWSAVFIPWLTEGRFPTGNVHEDPQGDEEERRVFHVAVTRARDILFLLVPATAPDNAGLPQPVRASRFITEVDEQLFAAAGGGRPSRPPAVPARPAPAHLQATHAGDLSYEYEDSPF